MYKNALENISKFFQIDVRETPEEIFNVLKDIINFSSAGIYLADKEVYGFNVKNQAKYNISKDLKFKNSAFGKIILTRHEKFTPDEKLIFNACAAVISNLIKDAELSKIITLQLKTLQEGIYETNKAYKSAKNQNDFFSNFSHELRTPINAVISSSELLAEGIFGKLNEKQKEYVNDIRISSLTLLGMINDILDMAKLENAALKLNPTTFILNQNIEEVCNILKPLADKKNIIISKKIPKTLKITADYTKIQQILFNLINNAIKYTLANGKIEVSAKKTEDYIYIAVKDNGIGIEKKHLKKIFQKFVQLGNEKNSNGLGLTITKELVKLHKGRIFAESTPSKGSTFTIQLNLGHL